MIQSDGKLVVTGTLTAVTSVLVAWRFNPNGTLDNSFDFDGELSTSLSNKSYANAAIIHQGNKLVLAGYSTIPNKVFAPVKYNNNGSVDNSFGSNGIVLTDIGIFNDIARAVAIQKDGKILVAGHSFQNYKYKLALARYNVDGTLDNGFNNTFGGNGKVTTDIGNKSIDMGASVVLQSDGKILVGGSTHNGAKLRFCYCALQ